MTAPHTVEGLLRDATNRCTSNDHLARYQALLLDKDRMPFDESLTIHALILLLSDDPEEPIHDFLETFDIIQGVQPDLTDIPLTIRDADSSDNIRIYFARC